MTEFATVLTDSHVLVINLETGEEVKFNKGDEQFDAAVELIKNNEHESVFALSIKHVITKFFDADETDSNGAISANIENGVGKLTLHAYNNMEVALNPVITSRIIKMREQGFDCKPIMNFLGNVYNNPSQTAIDELYLFAEASDLPITEDGHIIAYKIVRDDYNDEYSGTIDNSVGKVVSMPRSMVDDDRNRTCSKGLHFCSRGYLPSYGNGGSRCMLVKINPADVVAIPSDYKNAKGRTWRYEVVGELPKGWRTSTMTSDYTTKAVVDGKGKETVAAAKPSVKPLVSVVKSSPRANEIAEALDVMNYTIKIVDDENKFWCNDYHEFVECEEVSAMIGDSDDDGNPEFKVSEVTAYLKSFNPAPSSIPFPASKAPANVQSCPHCGSVEFQRKGKNGSRTKDRFKCKGCEKTYYI